MFLSWLWWDVISCLHRHAYKPWWQLPLFLSSCCPSRSFSSSFSAGKCHVDLAFPSTDSRFSSLMQTPLVLVCLLNEYTYCYVRNIHIRRQGPPPASGDSGEVMDVTVVAEDQRPDKAPPSRSPSSHVSTSFTTNIYQRYVKGLKLASLSTFLFCARICREIFCSLFFLFSEMAARWMDAEISPALHWSFPVDRVRVSYYYIHIMTGRIFFVLPLFLFVLFGLLRTPFVLVFKGLWGHIATWRCKWKNSAYSLSTLHQRLFGVWGYRNRSAR